jgi:AraC-like DNA-binding protein
MSMPVAESLAIASTGLMLGVAVMATLQIAIGHRGPTSVAWLQVIAAAVIAMGLGDLSAQLGATDAYRLLEPFADSALLSIGPALWLYVRQWGDSRASTRRRWLTAALHHAPAVFFCVLLLVGAMRDAPELPGSHRSAAELVILAPIAAQLIAYAVALAMRIVAIRRRALSYYSDMEDRDLAWILVMTLLYTAGVLAWILTWRWTLASSNALTGLIVAAATGWLGIRGSRQRATVTLQAAPEVEPATSDPPDPRIVGDAASQTASDTVSATASYSKARLGDDRAGHIRSRLAAAMSEDKAYLESDLTLAELASRVGATPHQLSQYLSVHERQSFYDYVNLWRVEAVKATLLRAGAARRPLMEVALECGFGSKSAFNTVFKRVTGSSPSAWRDGLPGSAARTTIDKTTA